MTPLADCGHQGSDSGLIRVKARTIPCGECYDALLARLKQLEAVVEAARKYMKHFGTPPQPREVYKDQPQCEGAYAYRIVDALAALEQP